MPYDIQTVAVFRPHALYFVLAQEAGERRIEILLFEGDMCSRELVEAPRYDPGGVQVRVAQRLREFVKALAEEGVILCEGAEKIGIFLYHDHRLLAERLSLHDLDQAQEPAGRSIIAGSAGK